MKSVIEGIKFGSYLDRLFRMGKGLPTPEEEVRKQQQISEITTEMNRIALQIHAIRDKVDPEIDHLSEARVPFVEASGRQLDAYERSYFKFFNQLRLLYGLTVLTGEKFTGDHEYRPIRM